MLKDDKEIAEIAKGKGLIEKWYKIGLSRNEMIIGQIQEDINIGCKFLDNRSTWNVILALSYWDGMADAKGEKAHHFYTQYLIDAKSEIIKTKPPVVNKKPAVAKIKPAVVEKNKIKTFICEIPTKYTDKNSNWTQLELF